MGWSGKAVNLAIGVQAAQVCCSLSRITYRFVEFGLVGAVHMGDEHVAVADIEALTEVYAAILEDYFGWP